MGCTASHHVVLDDAAVHDVTDNSRPSVDASVPKICKPSAPQLGLDPKESARHPEKMTRWQKDGWRSIHFGRESAEDHVPRKLRHMIPGLRKSKSSRPSQEPSLRKPSPPPTISSATSPLDVIAVPTATWFEQGGAPSAQLQMARQQWLYQSAGAVQKLLDAEEQPCTRAAGKPQAPSTPEGDESGGPVVTPDGPSIEDVTVLLDTSPCSTPHGLTLAKLFAGKFLVDGQSITSSELDPLGVRRVHHQLASSQLSGLSQLTLTSAINTPTPSTPSPLRFANQRLTPQPIADQRATWFDDSCLIYANDRTSTETFTAALAARGPSTTLDMPSRTLDHTGSVCEDAPDKRSVGDGSSAPDSVSAGGYESACSWATAV